MFEDYIIVEKDGTHVLLVQKWAAIEDRELQEKVFDYFMNFEKARLQF